MEKFDLLTEDFRKRLEAFEMTCDSLDDVSEWNIDELGGMDVYYLNELVSMILRLIVADGTISAKEAEYVSKYFGFDYTVDDLNFIYENCRNELDHSFRERLLDDINKMRPVSEKLVEEFRGLADAICTIIAESDGAVTEEELKEIQNIKAALQAD